MKQANLARFDDLTATLDRAEWRVLAAIAVEHVLGRSACASLFTGAQPGGNKRPRDVGEWLEWGLEQGLLVRAGPTRAAVLTSAATREPGFGVAPAYHQRALRTSAARGVLAEVAAESRKLLGARSVGHLDLSLQSGALNEFEKRFPVPPYRPEHGPRTRSEWLRESVCEPFDPEWFLRTWRGDAPRVAALVLRECSFTLRPCSELYVWAAARAEALEDGDERAEFDEALCQQAIFRGMPEAARAFADGLEAPKRRAVSAVLCFLGGELSEMNAVLDAAARRENVGATARQRDALPDCGVLAPLLGLLLCARPSGERRRAAKRLMGASRSGVDAGTRRAFRMLLDQLFEPEAEPRRIDVHQLPADASAWERLLLALTVHLHVRDRWARAAWAMHLVQAAVEWRGAGYDWMAVQAALLAQVLDAEMGSDRLARESPPASASRDLSLWDSITPKPEWEKVLEALGHAAEAVVTQERSARRVTWVVDMTDGRLARPLLQELSPAAGWTEGRRLTLSELWELRSELPAEDIAVLDRTAVRFDGKREFSPEAAEALIGHPRVVDGIRGRTPIEVVRGRCRIETVEERGHIRVAIEPRGAELGVHVVTESERRLVVYRVTQAMQRVMQALPRAATIPKEHERELVAVLGKLAESVEVESRLLGSQREVEADPTVCLRFSVHAGAWQVQLGIRPFGREGRFFLAGRGPEALTFFSGGQRLSCRRDFDAEKTGQLALRDACPTLSIDPDPEARTPLDPDDSWLLGEEGALALLSDLREANRPCAIEWPESPRLRLAGKATSRSLHGKLRSTKGWYLATGGVRLDDLTEVALAQLVMAPAIAGGRFVRLPSGDYVELEARIRRVIAALKVASPRTTRAGELRLPPSALSVLTDVAEPGSGFEIDPSSSEWLARVARLSNQPFETPPAMNATLRPYQREGYRWLRCLSELGLGACLADDMGLGKTLQILALLVSRAVEGPALVVAPTSVCANWLSEMRRFAPSLTAIEYAGKERRGALEALSGSCVVVCSYSLLQQDVALGGVKWSTVVLDEAQFIKNAKSLRARAAFALTARHRVAATGTPVENHFGDLWSIFHFLNPGLLGDHRQFRRRFQAPVERGESEEVAGALGRLIRPFVLRRLKRDVLSELPPVTEVELSVRLSEDEALRYAVLRKRIHEKLHSGKGQNKLQVLAEITRLRRFCCHPRLVFPQAPSESSKVRSFLELAEELADGGHRALVFSQFVDFLALVREQLDERGIRYEYLDGSTPNAQRPARVEAFQSGSASLFLISLKAGGFGLNITAADYVVHLDPWWNPAAQAQATDRAHRIGQERPVTVYRLVTEDTIERRVVELHTRKQRLADALLDGGGDLGGVTGEELVALLETGT